MAGVAKLRFLDGPAWSVTWIAPEPAYMRRASHAVGLDDGRVVLIDPVDGEGLRERIEALGSVAAVLQLLDRHNRDGRELAQSYGVPLVELPFDGFDDMPFEPIPLVRLPGWREVALWWPEKRALFVAESLGTAPYYLAPGAAAGVHPMRRLLPPTSLRDLPVQHLLVGHGEGIHGPEAASAVHTAVTRARRETPAWFLELIRHGPKQN